mmetsp:Transcript_23074/g.61209  ORF Transcript_23074/g.61209 Transcript_23074/m.61209 type:complete len:141 (+) Transcript_23074:3-425(+)
MERRLEEDVLAVAGVKYVMVLIGINDILTGNATSAGLIAAHERVAGVLNGAGLVTIGGLMLPCARHRKWTAEKEAVRKEVNDWVKKSGVYHHVVDFEKAVWKEGSEPMIIKEEWSEDGLHPNDEGYKAMAKAVDVVKFFK